MYTSISRIRPDGTRFEGYARKKQETVGFHINRTVVSQFLAAALVPRRVIVEAGFDRGLVNVGCCLSGEEYNHSLARLIGCLLMEHNSFLPLSSDLRTKIGGASPLTATRLIVLILQTIMATSSSDLLEPPGEAAMASAQNLHDSACILVLNIKT